MRIERFSMERTQCIYENLVDYNLSESGVMPLRVEELIEGVMKPAELLRTKLSYSWAGGSPTLRERIGQWYGVDAEHIAVTNGSSEANFMEFWGLLEKGDRAAIMLPNYLQTWGLARHFVGRADPYRLTLTKAKDGTKRWSLDIDSLKKAVSSKTKVILVTNPNNPLGSVLTAKEMDAIIRIARKADAWIIADEVYRGAELEGDTGESFLGRGYDNVLITGGLSKAFGLPGLRIGWIAGPPKVVRKLESYHDYLTLTPTMLSEKLALVAMERKTRERLLERTKKIVRTQLPELETWIDGREDLSYVRPQAGAIAMIKYRGKISSLDLFQRLIDERSVLITPGVHFNLPGKYFRVGYGYDMEHTLKGLSQIGSFLDSDVNGRGGK